jgi:hypothetical protein
MARHLIHGGVEGAHVAYRTVRTELAEYVPPHAVDAALKAYRDEGRRLAAAELLASWNGHYAADPTHAHFERAEKLHALGPGRAIRRFPVRGLVGWCHLIPPHRAGEIRQQ